MKRLFLILIILITFPCKSFDVLRQCYPWPIEKPLVSPDPQSMFSNTQYMKAILNPNITLIVELGSWLGASARFMLDHAQNSYLIAIDHWQGSSEHQGESEWAHKLPTLYETFLVNCWHYRRRLIPMKTTTLEGLQEIYDVGLQPDLIYVDAAHDYNSVMADLEKIYALFPQTHIVGDDWGWPGVRAAVIDFARKRNFIIYADDNFWDLTRKKRDFSTRTQCVKRSKFSWDIMVKKRMLNKRFDEE